MKKRCNIDKPCTIVIALYQNFNIYIDIYLHKMSNNIDIC